MTHKKRKSKASDPLSDLVDVTKFAIGAEVSLAALSAVEGSLRY